MKKTLMGLSLFISLTFVACQRNVQLVAEKTPSNLNEVSQSIPEYNLALNLSYNKANPDSAKIFVSSNFKVDDFSFQYNKESGMGYYALRVRRIDSEDKLTYYAFGAVDFANPTSSRNSITYFKKNVEIFN